MEPELKKTKTNVQPVEEQKPTPVKEPSIDDFVKGLDPGKVKMAEKMGIPLTQLLQYMKYQEDKLNFVVENMPTGEKLWNYMEKRAKETQQQQMQEYQRAMAQNPAAAGVGGMGGLGQLAQLLPYVIGSGGGEDPIRKKLLDELLTAQILNIKSNIGFAKAIQDAVVTKIAGKAAAGLSEIV